MVLIRNSAAFAPGLINCEAYLWYRLPSNTTVHTDCFTASGPKLIRGEVLSAFISGKTSNDWHNLLRICYQTCTPVTTIRNFCSWKVHQAYKMRKDVACSHHNMPKCDIRGNGGLFNWQVCPSIWTMYPSCVCCFHKKLTLHVDDFYILLVWNKHGQACNVDC